MERVKKYVRVFIKVGVCFALIILLPMILKYGFRLGLIATILSSIIWTVIMATFFIPVDYISTRKLPHEALTIRQERKLCLRGDSEQVFEKSLAVLKTLSFIKVVTPAKERMQLSAQTKKSFTSFRENIELQLNMLNKEAIEIHVISYPAVRYTLLDFGKNFRNVELINKELKNSIGYKGVGPS